MVTIPDGLLHKWSKETHAASQNLWNRNNMSKRRKLTQTKIKNKSNLARFLGRNLMCLLFFGKFLEAAITMDKLFE